MMKHNYLNHRFIGLKDDTAPGIHKLLEFKLNLNNPCNQRNLCKSVIQTITHLEKMGFVWNTN
jgi:hypothetical protein